MILITVMIMAILVIVLLEAMRKQEAVKNIICPFCGMDINEEHLFCPYCSSQIKKTCSNCSAIIKPFWKVCAYCGTKVQKRDTDES